jgi:hemerythrin
MAVYNWNATTMATGNAEVDAAHQLLIKKLNELLTLMQAGQGGTKLNEVLDFLERYAVKHFAHEEACMNEYRCPVAGANKAAHAKFIRTFTDIKKRLQKDGPSAMLVLEVQRELGDWLTSHIVKIDTGLKACVMAHA